MPSAIVKYNYQAQQFDELSLSMDARIFILEKSNTGWWLGQYGKKIGWFPSNHTQEELHEPISSAIVKYNYQAQQLDELSLSKGARILILEKSGDGWWRGQYGNKIGWFPSNYTQEELEDAHTYCMAENVFDIMVALYTFKVSTIFPFP